MPVQRNKISPKKDLTKKFLERGGTLTPEEAATTQEELAAARKVRTAEGVARGTEVRRQIETIKQQTGLGEHDAKTLRAVQLEAKQITQPSEVLAARKDLAVGISPTELTEAQLKKPSLSALEAGGAAVSGVTGAVAGGLAGAKIGGLIGTSVGPVGTAIGAGLGFAGGVFTAITFEKRQSVREALDTFTGATGNVEWAIAQLKAGGMSSYRGRMFWEQQIVNIRAAERNMKILNKNLNKFLSGGSDEAATIQAYINRLPDIKNEYDRALAQAELLGT